MPICTRIGQHMVTILLVEDHGVVRAGIRAQLSAIDPASRISEAGSFEEAIALLEQCQFDIAFVDIDLRAEKGGLDFLAHVRARDLPLQVVMLSADDDPNTVLHCISAGAAGYIPKSMDDPKVFENALDTVMKGGVFLPNSVLRDRDRRLGREMLRSLPGKLNALPPSSRLREVLYYVCQGLTNKGIAQRMGIAEGTVRKSYVSELLRFYNVTRRTELIIEISRLGIRIPNPTSSHSIGPAPE